MLDTACVDLFCGAGGLTHGLNSEGINVVAGVDVDAACKHPFEFNNSAIFIKEDVSNITAKNLDALFGGAAIRILAGCAPCQPFSTYSQRYETIGSPRWGLLYQFSRLIKTSQPDIVAMENVPSVAKHVVFIDFVEALQKMGYSVAQDIVDCSLYGLPQSRKRMVLLASRLGGIQLAAPSNDQIMTVREAIGDLPAIVDGEAHTADPLHIASKLTDLNRRRIKASRPGGTWRDWPKDLVAECHRRDSGRTYPGVYGRMVWDSPSPTLTTQFYGFGNGRFGHPVQDRAISLREGAILQGFPRTYSFVPEGGRIQFKALGRMIGNAVPVTLGKVIGKAIIDHLGYHSIELKVRSERDCPAHAGQALVA